MKICVKNYHLHVVSPYFGNLGQLQSISQQLHNKNTNNAYKKNTILSQTFRPHPKSFGQRCGCPHRTVRLLSDFSPCYNNSNDRAARPRSMWAQWSGRATRKEKKTKQQAEHSFSLFLLLMVALGNWLTSHSNWNWSSRGNLSLINC